MAGPWLFAISESADRTFKLDDISIPVTVDSFRELIANGRIVEDRYWRISQLWRDVEIGDELFIYTGDENLGIIGYARISGTEERDGDWFLLPVFDLARSLMLLDQPIPARIVRDWVPSLRRNVTNLDVCYRQLREQLPW